MLGPIYGTIEKKVQFEPGCGRESFRILLKGKIMNRDGDTRSFWEKYRNRLDRKEDSFRM